MATAPTAEPASRGAMAPEPYRVVSRAPETADTWTLLLEPLGAPIVPAPGQFNMLYAFGVGEVPISTSAAPEPGGELVHTIRAVGPVTRALCATEPGDVIGVRGPFGTTWPLEQARGGDLVIVAGGIGLAPVRPAVYHALAHRDDYVSFCLLVGAQDTGRPALRARARGLARPLRRRGGGDRGQRRRRLARPRRRRAAPDPLRRLRSRRAPPRSSSVPRS